VLNCGAKIRLFSKPARVSLKNPQKNNK